MPFEDLVEKLKNPGEEGVPDTIYDDLTSEYNNVMVGSQETIAKRDETIAALQADNTSLKTKNYDLLVSVTSNSSPTEVVDEPSEPTIDSLFIKKG